MLALDMKGVTQDLILFLSWKLDVKIERRIVILFS